MALDHSILERLVPSRLFARLTIARKILLGYMTLGLLTVVVIAYALFGIQRLNAINQQIVTNDIPVQETAGRMIDALLAQNMYEKRFLILRSSDMRSLFEDRGNEFRSLLNGLRRLRDTAGLPLTDLENLHREYTELFRREVQLVRKRKVEEARALSDEQLATLHDQLIETTRTMSSQAKVAQNRKMRKMSAIGNTSFVTTVFLWMVTVAAGAAAGFVVTHHIASSLRKLKVATAHISEGNFDYDPKIETRDEIGDLATAFVAMGKRLRKLEEMYLDASPLTRLPGGIAIENVVKKRLDSKKPVAFCVLDLDNFKAFNDRYGYANGSEVIKETAKIIEAAVRKNGTADDFIGHVGGDDFVIVTDPEHMREISEEIIREFDRRIPDFYDQRDRELGHIRGKTRQGVEMDFPIMTISIAVVTNERRRLSTPLEASEIAAELKDYAKTIPKSVFVIDKRRTS